MPHASWNHCFVGFEVLTAASVKMDVFWVVALCSLMEETSTSETSVNLYQTIRRYNPEVSNLLSLFCSEYPATGPVSCDWSRILSCMTTVHSLASCFIIRLFLPSNPRSVKWFFPSGFCNWNFACISHRLNAYYMSNTSKPHSVWSS
jgi:hypothetical protein